MMRPISPAFLLDKIHKSIVTIKIQSCLPMTAKEKLHDNVDESCTKVWGIVILCKNRFSYIIADSREFVGKIGPRQRICVEFPDGNNCWITSKQISLKETIVGISLKLSSFRKFNTSLIKGVELYEGPLKRCQIVYMYTPESNLLTPSSIMLPNNHDFQHSCGGTYDSEHGAPVFNSQGQFIGMNTVFHSDYMTAIGTNSIATLIAMCERRNFTYSRHTATSTKSVVINGSFVLCC